MRTPPSLPPSAPLAEPSRQPSRARPSRALALALAACVALAALALPACDLGDFGDLNEDPTRAERLDPRYLMTRALVFGTLRYDVYQRGQHLFGSMYAQHFANLIPTWPTDRYESGGTYDDWATALWRATYASYGGGEFIGENVSNSGVNVHTAVQLTQDDPGRININAQARIWRAFLMHRVTDYWGDVPYSEAFRGAEGIRAPRYDPQEEIYRDLLATLRQAADDLDPSITQPGLRLGQADVLYRDDLERWRRFAGTLRLRLAMRVAYVAPALAEEHVRDVLTRGLVMQGNADSALMLMGTAEGRFVNRNPLHVINLFEDDRVSATMVDQLRALEDPRLGIFADSVLARNQPFAYRGLPNGLGTAELGRIRRQEFSKLGWRLRRESSPVPVMLYAESAFLRAEAALRGWGPGTAQEWYEEGIRASMQHFGVTDAAAIDAYLARPGVAFAEADTDEARLERIITQKWIALFTDGFEAWAEYRRTGYPRLQPISGSGETNGAVPSRVLYVQEEYNTNRTNVAAAAERMGGDLMTTRVWWDTGRAPRP